MPATLLQPAGPRPQPAAAARSSTTLAPAPGASPAGLGVVQLRPRLISAAGRSASMQKRAAAAAAAAAGGASRPPRSSGEGSRAATQLVDATEEAVEAAERVLSKAAEAHLGAKPAGEEAEEANIWYFAYGSNINKKVFEGRRMISPAESLPATLHGWKLQFSQPGLPFSEPAFAAVEPLEAVPEAAGLPDVHGVAHRITPSQWNYVLETEGAAGQDDDNAYRVVEATAATYGGREVTVVTLTVPARIKARLQGRDALPSARYLKLIREGAVEYGLTEEYRQWLDTLRAYKAETRGQKLGAYLFGGFAFLAIFPVWAFTRVLRRVTGIKPGQQDRLSRLRGRYTAFAFSLVHGLHELLRPVLGCGTTMAAPPR